MSSATWRRSGCLVLVAVLLLGSALSSRAAPPILPQVIGDNELFEIRRTNRWPFSAVVRIRGHYDHKTNACSGVLIADNAVLTAAHCMYDKEVGAFAHSATIYPGKNGALNTFSSVSSRDILVSSDYVTASWGESHRFDWAVISLQEPAGAQVGWFPVERVENALLEPACVGMIGYPNGDCDDCPFTGKRPFLGLGASGFLGEDFLLHAVDSMHGSSGSGLFVRRGGRPRVCAVHSTSGDETLVLNSAARLTPDVLDQVAAFVGQYGGRTVCSGAPEDDPCCAPGDPCSLSDDGVCQCGGACAFDYADCGQGLPPTLCQSCTDDAECEGPLYCGNYASYPEFAFCVGKCGEIPCPDGFYCSSKGTCWVSAGEVCHYGHVWRLDTCGNHYKLVEACHPGTHCWHGRCLPEPLLCPLDQYEPDGPGTGPLLDLDGSQARSICPGGDEDEAVLTLTEPTTVRVETWGAAGDTLVAVYDAEGKLVALDDDGGDEAFSLLKSLPLEPGTYRIVVTAGLAGEPVPLYHLSVERAPCLPDCSWRECGDDGCGGTCGVCTAGTACLYGRCVCVAECLPGQCGINACGGDCGSCAGSLAECVEGFCQCTADCVSRECGDDGCGGSCGECAEELACVEGLCLCPPECADRECGDDGCGGSCGECAEELVCVEGQCLCQPACVERECGGDGCGGSCGNCPGQQDLCVDGQCLCQPFCVDRECGEDGCGGTCGACPETELCNQGSCVPQPTDCVALCTEAGAVCGAVAGCPCGSCTYGAVCVEGRCVAPEIVSGVPDEGAGDSVPQPATGCSTAPGNADRSAGPLPGLLVLLLLFCYGVGRRQTASSGGAPVVGSQPIFRQ